jgi:MATE family multidrug resistance protein
LNTNSFAFMVPLGLGGAVSTRVSNELGAGHPRAARLATRVVAVLALAAGVSEGVVMVLVRHQWGYAYSNEEEVVRYTARMMPLIAVSLVFDGMQSVLSGVVRGCGRQKAGAYINLAAYYLAGVPSAFVFAFVCRLGGMARTLPAFASLKFFNSFNSFNSFSALPSFSEFSNSRGRAYNVTLVVCTLIEQGLWLGIMCGLVVQMLLLLSITLCTNWNNEVSITSFFYVKPRMHFVLMVLISCMFFDLI